MLSLKRAIQYLLFNRNQFFDSLVKHMGFILPDKLYLSLRYRFNMGYWINWKSPKTFNEKLQWLKLYNRKQEYTTMVDKYAVKEYVANKIGAEYIIPTLGVWDRVEDIEWDKLPNQFVLKTTHGGGGGGVVICKDKSNFDRKAACKKLQDSLNSDIYLNFREWPYKDVPKRIIAEKFMTDNGKDLEDYKIHTFNGVPKFILVCRDRYKEKMIDDFYSDNWELLEVRRPGHPNSLMPQTPPQELAEMLRLSKILSKNIPFLRVDFYISDNKIFFGELTFFPASGMSKFEPEKWDKIFGDWLMFDTCEHVYKQ